jgi:hypothetical protein
MELTISLVVNAAVASARPGSQAQVRRETPSAAAWFASNGGLDAGVMLANRAAFLDAVAPAGDTETEKKRRQHWNWVAEKLKEAVESLQVRTRYATQAAARTRIIDELVPNSPLDLAIGQLLEPIRSKPDRWRVTRCDLSLWLGFLEERGIDPEVADLAELEQFRRWLDEIQPDGNPRRKSSKVVLVPARKLVRLFSSADRWVEAF